MFERAQPRPSAENGDEGPTVLDAITDPRGTAYLLATQNPGTGLALVDALPLSALDESACLDLLTGLERGMAWLASHQQRVLAVLQAMQIVDDPRDPAAGTWLREEVQTALRLAPRTAQHRIDTAVCLAERLPSTLRLLAGGQISYRHAVALADAVSTLDATTTAKVETRVLVRAPGQTPGEFQSAVRRAVLAADPATAEERHVQAADERGVHVRPVEDGMVELWALLSAPGAAVVMEAVNALASVTSAGDTRTMDQRRADSLVCLGSAVLNDLDAPRAQGLRPHIQVTVAATTLLGLDEEAAELDGYGPIPAGLARELAADPTGTWRRILTDPVSGTLLDYGTTRYRPPPALARHVMARDRECSFPHCHRRAVRCDLDHLTRWADGGVTSAPNLAPLCPRHHRAKDEHGWTVTRVPADGTYHWVSPTGRRYTRTPPRYGPALMAEASIGATEADDVQPAMDQSDVSVLDPRHVAVEDEAGAAGRGKHDLDLDPPPF